MRGDIIKLLSAIFSDRRQMHFTIMDFPEIMRFVASAYCHKIIAARIVVKFSTWRFPFVKLLREVDARTVRPYIVSHVICLKVNNLSR